MRWKRRIENGKCMINGCYGNNVDEGAEMAEGMGGCNKGRDRGSCDLCVDMCDCFATD